MEQDIQQVMRPRPVVQVRGLRKQYGGRTVVDDVDLDVHEGEIVGLLGANGAGKTTTVECIQGLRRPDGGAVRVLGLDPVTDGSRLRTLIGSQQQDSALPDRMRVGEAIELFRGPDASSADGLLEAFGLAAHRRTAFANLSGGQRQRLFLILALLNRPQLVVLDELTQGLDPAARRNVWDAIQALRDGGTTVLLVTHYMDEAEALCDRVVVMDAGRVLDSGRPADLVDRHARWATVRFSGPAGPERVAAWRGIPGVEAVSVAPATVAWSSGQRGTGQHGTDPRGTSRRTANEAVEVHGDRRMIAHVCADLVARDEVPDDLSVLMPDLEAALVSLLTAASTPVTTGGTR